MAPHILHIGTSQSPRPPRIYKPARRHLFPKNDETKAGRRGKERPAEPGEPTATPDLLLKPQGHIEDPERSERILAEARIAPEAGDALDGEIPRWLFPLDR